MSSLDEIKSSLDKDLATLEQDRNLQALHALKSKYLGKKGDIYSLLRQMGSLPAEERPEFGQKVNHLRDFAEASFTTWQENLESEAIVKSLNASTVDATLPGWRIPAGNLHPLSRLREEILDFFVALGFEIGTGPEVDTDWYNFEALNIPQHHSARDMHDTFYVDEKVVLRTHTSNVQVHMMENQKPPIRMIAPGHVYRVDNDATHSPMFQQVEGLVVDEGISFADLKGTLYLWVQHMFGKDVKLRFRPSYFPFTEPSAEMDISCFACAGKGCRICKKTGWIEIGGCGCVHPNVFRNVGWDIEKYTGFAFGFGIDRIAMLKYSIPDISYLTRNDNRFLKQF